MDDACDVAGIGAEWDVDWHIAALFIIIGTSAAGVFLPIVSQTTCGLRGLGSVPIYAIQLGQFFGAGVIVATAFIHLFPAAYAALTNACLGEFSDRYGAWASLFAMAAVFTMHSAEWWLVEAWLSRTGQQPRRKRRRNQQQICDQESDDDNDGDMDSSMLFPAYSRAFNASRMMLPHPAASARQFAGGTSTMSSRLGGGQHMAASAAALASCTGFALSKYGNYAAVVQSRQHLAMMHRMGDLEELRYLYSEPQFTHYAAGGWPMPPPTAPPRHSTLEMRGSAQAKSTPELMRKHARSARTSTGGSSGSRGDVSLRPNSFSNQVGRGLAGGGWHHRCLSMPRLLEPGLEEAGATRRSIQSALSELASPPTGSRLDTVPEADDAWVPASSMGEEGDDARMLTLATSASGGYVTAATGGRPPSALRRGTEDVSRSQTRKRVSIPTPPLRALAPASAFASVNTGLPPSDRLQAMQSPDLIIGDDDAQGSTAIHSSRSSESRLTYPVEVKRRALATYVLELGIALYSVLIGLALAISDRGFLALFLAVCFHQFFEGLALGTSLAELYWIKAQIAAQFAAAAVSKPDDCPADQASAAEPVAGAEARHKISLSSSAAAVGGSRPPSSAYHLININVVGSTTFSPNAGALSPAKRTHSEDDELCSADFEDISPSRTNRRSKSRRTLASMATSFTPEPWLVNPQLERTLAAAAVNAGGGPSAPALSTRLPGDRDIELGAKRDGLAIEMPRRYLQPRSAPERLPGWWKAWLSALAFTMTTPAGIVIGLAVRHIYEPRSAYALLFNGVLQSICTGVLVYAALVTLMIGGFNSPQVKRMSRLQQLMLFFAVYAGAAVMAALKIWK